MNKWVLKAGKTTEKWINLNPKHNQSGFHRNTDVWLLCMTDLAIWLHVCSDLTIEKGHLRILVFEDPSKDVMLMALEISLNSCVKVHSCTWLTENQKQKLLGDEFQASLGKVLWWGLGQRKCAWTCPLMCALAILEGKAEVTLGSDPYPVNAVFP